MPVTEYTKKLDAMAERMAKAKLAKRFISVPKWETRDYNNRRSLIMEEMESAKICLESCAYWYNQGRLDKDIDVDVIQKVKKHGL